MSSYAIAESSRIMKFFLAIALFTVLPSLPVQAQNSRMGPSDNPFQPQARQPEKSLMQIPQALAGFRNRTRLNLTSSHGPQVTYTSADGKSFLWYPGNQMILGGEWKVEPRDAQHRTSGEIVKIPVVCFKYGANTYNPATGSRGAVWECNPAQSTLRRSVESEPGDIFGLSKRTQPPFVLTRDIRTLTDIKQRKKERQS